MKVINQEELFNILAEVKGATPCGLSTITKVDARKTGNPYGEIYKLSKSNCFVGINYEANVNNALEKAGHVPYFDAEQRKWGNHLTAAIIQKGDKSYLAANVLKTAPTYLYRKNGILTIVKKEKIAQFLPPEKAEIVRYRNFSLDNIVGINIGGAQYRVKITNKISTKKLEVKPAKVKSIKKIKKNYSFGNTDPGDPNTCGHATIEDQIWDDPNAHIDEFLDCGDK